MPTLVLIRHAKALDSDPRGDHERALSDRGRRDAQTLGTWLGERELAPDLVLVSTAVRTRQTVESLLVGVTGQDVGDGRDGVETWATRRIYDGGTDGVLEAVREAPDTAGVLWVVGHEPVMSGTTWDLADGAGIPHEVTAELVTGFPTSSAAVLRLELPWAEVGFGCAALISVHTSRA